LPRLFQSQAQLEPLVARQPRMNQIQPQHGNSHIVSLQQRIMQSLQWHLNLWKLDLSHSIFRLPCS